MFIECNFKQLLPDMMLNINEELKIIGSTKKAHGRVDNIVRVQHVSLVRVPKSIYHSILKLVPDTHGKSC